MHAFLAAGSYALFSILKTAKRKPERAV